MNKIHRNDRLWVLLISVIFIFSILSFFSFDTGKVSSSEVGFSSLSPTGTSGGEVIPASCESGYQDGVGYTYGSYGACQSYVSAYVSPNPVPYQGNYTVYYSGSGPGISSCSVDYYVYGGLAGGSYNLPTSGSWSNSSYWYQDVRVDVWCWNVWGYKSNIASVQIPIEPPPSVSILLNGTGGSLPMSYNSSATISWSSSYVSSCSTDFGPSGGSGSYSTGALQASRTYTINCVGRGPNPAYVSANVTANVSGFNASCGTANGVVTSPIPSSNLCSAGTASVVSSSNPNAYTWTCAGANGGSTASCSAPRPSPSVNINATPGP